MLVEAFSKFYSIDMFNLFLNFKYDWKFWVTESEFWTYKRLSWSTKQYKNIKQTWCVKYMIKILFIYSNLFLFIPHKLGQKCYAEKPMFEHASITSIDLGVVVCPPILVNFIGTQLCSFMYTLSCVCFPIIATELRIVVANDHKP